MKTQSRTKTFPDYVIHFDRKFRGSYRLSVSKTGLVEIQIGDREHETEAFAEDLIRKHRRFINRRLRILESRAAHAEAAAPERQQPLRRSEALKILQPLFIQLTREMELPLWTLTVRDARTRWGSCSHQTRRVMLNIQAARLPVVLQRYLIVHELAHIRHLGHGDAFWKFVARFDPEYKTNRKVLREEYGWLLAK